MLLSIGKPMVDIIVQVDSSFLKKYRLNPNDAIKASESQSELFEDVLKMNPKFVPLGGSVINTVRVFKWATEKKENVFLIGVIGGDQFGRQIKLKLKNEKIKYGFVEISNETVQCAVLISNNGKNRSLVTNSNLKSTQVMSGRNVTFNEFKERVFESSCFYVPTYSLVMFSDVIKEIVEHFVTNQKKIAINLGATYILEKYSDDVKYLIQHADVVIGNAVEYRTLAKTLNALCTDLQNILMTIKSLSSARGKDQILVVTQGDKDILVYYEGCYKYFQVDPVQQIVDTTGAGDAFAGGFLAQYIKNASLDNCIYSGTACANHIIQRLGCDFDPDFKVNNLFN